MAIAAKHSIAVWSLTPNGLSIARQLGRQWPGATFFVPRKMASEIVGSKAMNFDRLTDTVVHHFHGYSGHIFIMAAGIVVRSIAPHLKHKTADPAVVVMDERGRFAISLISGHIGGANRLAAQAAEVLGATPVITTATDISGKLAIDVLAVDRGMTIENPERIKPVNMALLTDDPICLHDPDGRLGDSLPNTIAFPESRLLPEDAVSTRPGVWVDDTTAETPPGSLVLRPASLVAGIGCNRRTPKEEIRAALFDVLHQFGLARRSVCAIASIDLKSDEAGLIELGVELDLQMHFFSRDELAAVEDVPTPSTTVAKHVGVPSVCEASALLASRNGRLIVPKQSTRNVTVAIARQVCMSSGSDPGTQATCPNAPVMS